MNELPEPSASSDALLTHPRAGVRSEAEYRSGMQPIWMMVKTGLLARIQMLKSGDPLPTYEELAQEMRCSIVPVKHAMRELEREGWVSLQRGRPARVLWTSSFSRSAQRAGHKISTRAFHTAYRPLEPAEEAIGRELNREPGQPCLVCGRVRTVDGQTVALQLSYINPMVFTEPQRFFLDHDVVSGSLREVYAGLGVRPLRVTAVLKAGSADERERLLLSLPAGAPVLRSHQQTVVELGGRALVLEVMNATYTSEIDYVVERLPRWDISEFTHDANAER